MKQLFIRLSCVVYAMTLIGCTDPIGEQTIIGTLDSVPYYADDYSPHFGYEFADWLFDWAPTVRTEDGTEYIIKRKMFRGGGDIEYDDGSNDKSNWFYTQHIFADGVIYKGDTIKVTGYVRKHNYGGNKKLGIGGGNYLWIEGAYTDVHLVSRGEIYRQLKDWQDSKRTVYQARIVQ